jgi:hypothetical protein
MTITIYHAQIGRVGVEKTKEQAQKPRTKSTPMNQKQCYMVETQHGQIQKLRD